MFLIIKNKNSNKKKNKTKKQSTAIACLESSYVTEVFKETTFMNLLELLGIQTKVL